LPAKQVVLLEAHLAPRCAVPGFLTVAGILAAEPLRKPMRPPSKPPFDPRTLPGDVDEDEHRLFLEAVEHLESVPDKDRVAATQGPSPGLRRLRPSKSKRARPEAQLDLHGQTTREAIPTLGRFLAEAMADGLKVVLVITGKGQSSPGRTGVLKGTVEGWIERHGERYLTAFSEAPRILGGRGAYVCYLRRPKGGRDVPY
jgi:DNA-nicking Smr family endonuclease